MSRDSMPNKVEQGLYKLLDDAGTTGVSKSQWDELAATLMTEEDIKSDMSIRADMRKRYTDSIWHSTIGKKLPGYNVKGEKVKQVQVYLDSTADKGKRSVLIHHCTVAQMQRAANYRTDKAARHVESAAADNRTVDEVVNRAGGDYQQLAFQFFDKDEDGDAGLTVAT